MKIIETFVMSGLLSMGLLLPAHAANAQPIPTNTQSSVPSISPSAMPTTAPGDTVLRPLTDQEKDQYNQILHRLDQERTANNVAAVKVNPELDEIAQRWTQDMVSANSLSHNSQLYTQVGGDWNSIGENVGYAQNADTLFDAWIASPSHYAVLKMTDYTDVGTGVIIDDTGKLWSTQIFADYNTHESTATVAPAPIVATPVPTTTVTVTVKAPIQPYTPAAQPAKVAAPSVSYVEPAPSPTVDADVIRPSTAPVAAPEKVSVVANKQDNDIPAKDYLLIGFALLAAGGIGFGLRAIAHK